MIKIQDLVTLAQAGWTPKQVKEVLEMLSTSPTADQEAAPEKLKEEADIKAVDELPKVEEQPKEDPIEGLRNLIKED